MTAPQDPHDESSGERSEAVDMNKQPQAAPAPFDPYRFGRPEHPVPPEFAPPGYVPPAAEPPRAAPPWGSQQGPGYPPPQPGAPYPTFDGRQQYHPGYPPPYGAPAPPPYGPYQQQPTGNGRAVTALVCGIASIPLCFLSFFDIVPIVLALIFGLLGLGDSSRRNGRGRTMAIAGLVCMGIGTVLAVILTVFYVHAANACGGFANNTTDPTAFQQCFSHHL